MACCKFEVWEERKCLFLFSMARTSSTHTITAGSITTTNEKRFYARPKYCIHVTVMVVSNGLVLQEEVK